MNNLLFMTIVERIENLLENEGTLLLGEMASRRDPIEEFTSRAQSLLRG